VFNGAAGEGVFAIIWLFNSFRKTVVGGGKFAGLFVFFPLPMVRERRSLWMDGGEGSAVTFLANTSEKNCLIRLRASKGTLSLRTRDNI